MSKPKIIPTSTRPAGGNPPTPESVEGEAGSEAVTLFVCEVCGRYWGKSEGKQQFYCQGVGHERHKQTKAQPVKYVPESSLNAALAEAERAWADAKLASQLADEKNRELAAALARAESLEIGNEGMWRRMIETEERAEKWEALAAGQAATIERIRKWAEDKIEGVTRGLHNGTKSGHGLGERDAAREVLSLLNPKESE